MARPSQPPRSPKNSPYVIPGGLIAEEIKFKAPEDAVDKRHRIWKDKISFLVKDVAVYAVGFLLIAAVACYSFWVLLHPSMPKEDRQFAMTILASAASAVFGIVFGKSMK